MIPATPTAGLRPTPGLRVSGILAEGSSQGSSIPEGQLSPSTTTSISGDDASRATGTAADVALFSKDPVTGTPIPPKGAPPHISQAALRHHLYVTKELSQDLASDRSEIPKGFGDCLDFITGMAPHHLLRHQRQMLSELQSFAKETAHLDEKVMDEASPTVGSVLRAASKTGLKVALVHRYLKMVNHEDADDLFRDLSHGFPLVGDIPVSPVAPPVEVRTATFPLGELGDAASELADSLFRQHAVAPRTGDGVEAERKVFSQTPRTSLWAGWALWSARVWKHSHHTLADSGCLRVRPWEFQRFGASTIPRRASSTTR